MGRIISYDEASGAVVSFDCNIVRDLKKCEINIEPVQSGTGDPSPDNVRPISGCSNVTINAAGRNLIPSYSFLNGYTTNGITVTYDSDRILHFNGMATANAWFFISRYSASYNTGFKFKPGIYKLSGMTVQGGPYGLRLQASTYKNGVLQRTYPNIGSNAISVTVLDDELVDMYVHIPSGYVADDLIVKPMLSYGNEDHEYEPYAGNTYNITFPSAADTVYGGKLDLINGVLTVNSAQITSYAGETLPGKWISDRDVYVAGVMPTTGAQVVYELATLITYQLTPQEIKTIIGTNTIYADTGDVSVYYPKTFVPVETFSNVNLLDIRRSIMASTKAPETAKVYGVEWNYADPSTILRRTGAAANFANPIPAESLNEVGWSPFDNVYPWSEMKRYNIINGEVAYSEDDAGYSETDYDTMIYIPEFYYYAYKDTANQKWYWSISGIPLEGYEKHPGSGRYVGRFHTSGDSSALFSKGNVSPFISSRKNSRTYSHNKGNNWWQIDLATWSAIQLLYIIEFANFNSQDVLGRGQNSGNIINTGSTTDANYHTIKRSGTSNTYHWIENPFSNILIWIDGYISNNKTSYISTNPTNYSDTTSDMTNVNINLPNSSGYITNFGYNKNFNWLFIPNASGGTDNTKVSDYVGANSGLRVLAVGGSNTDYAYFGFFYFNAYNDTSVSNSGSRLIFIPSN